MSSGRRRIVLTGPPGLGRPEPGTPWQHGAAQRADGEREAEVQEQVAAIRALAAIRRRAQAERVARG